MATPRDTTDISDPTKFKMEPDGSFKRPASVFRSVIEKGGAFEPEADRYHLYVSFACPWAHRTLIVRKLKGLEDIISVTVVSPMLGANGWPFASVDKFPGAEVDPLYNSEHVKDLYFRADPNYSARPSVPVLWDKKTHTVVNNESSEIIRIFNTAFNDLLPSEKANLDFYPANFRSEIDEINEWVYPNINNGVYLTGMAKAQAPYEKAVHELFDALDKVEKILTGKDYLVGGRLTEADVRLYVTIIRFDPVYFGHFKCNIRTIRDGYPAIHAWLRKLYWKNDAFTSTTDFNHIKTHYYWSHSFINPSRVVAAGPVPHIKPL